MAYSCNQSNLNVNKMDCNKNIEKCGMCGHTMAELRRLFPGRWLMTDSARQLGVGQCYHPFCFLCVEHMINIHDRVGGTINCPTCLQSLTDFIELQIAHDENSDDDSDDDETCDCCVKSWKDDQPEDETCECIHSKCNNLLRYCRYTCRELHR